MLHLVIVVLLCSQWKFHKVALEMLLLLVRHDTRLPTSAVQLFVNNIINSTINVRKVGLPTVIPDDTSVKSVIIISASGKITARLLLRLICLRCFDAVGWVAGMASGL